MKIKIAKNLLYYNFLVLFMFYSLFIFNNMLRFSREELLELFFFIRDVNRSDFKNLSFSNNFFEKNSSEIFLTLWISFYYVYL